MSTYTGDATITNVLSVSASRTTTSGTTLAYTVPAGRFAEVQFKNASSSGGLGGGTWSANAFIGAAGFANGDDSNGGTSETIRDFPDVVILNEGDTVGVSLSIFTATESVSMNAIVKEYNKP